MTADGGNYAESLRVARDYYNSEDADRFYALVWGGEDIHVGLYEKPDEPIAEASARTVEFMASRLQTKLGREGRVLDIGSGYCGAARHLAQSTGCHVTGLNLSDVENVRARKLNQEQGLADRVTVMDGSFEKMPFEATQFDVVWSQDALLHSGARAEALAEVARVLKPGGEFIFTDPMQADSCPEGVLAPILERIHLSDLGSPAFYKKAAEDVGLTLAGFDDMTPQLVRHYSRVLEETTRRGPELAGEVSEAYQERMKAGLQHWIDGGNRGYLAWGVFRFVK